VKIREANIKDVRRLVELGKALYLRGRYDEKSGIPYDGVTMAAILTRGILRGTVKAFVAEDKNGGVVGCAVGSVTPWFVNFRVRALQLHGSIGPNKKTEELLERALLKWAERQGLKAATVSCFEEREGRILKLG